MNRNWLLIAVLVGALIVVCSSAGCIVINQGKPPAEPSPNEAPPQQSVLTEGQVDFTVTPASIQPGKCATLRWNVPSRQTHSITLNGNPVNNSGQQQVCPQATEVYNLDVDMGGSMIHKEVTLNVAPGGP